MTRILIVDDDEQERTLLGLYLEANGYECSLVASAEEGRKILQAEQFHLILSDVNMPGESGLDFLKWALTVNPKSAGLIMTGLSTPEISTKAIEIGAFRCLNKPIPSDLLLASLSGALDKHVQFTDREET